MFPDFPGNFFIIAGERRYKAKQQKGKTTRQKKDPNEPQAVFDMMDKAVTKIRTIDTSAWSDEDKINFQESLTNLKTEIDNYLNAPTPR